jgi:hypoxanthine phosphoribosyltransferase
MAEPAAPLPGARLVASAAEVRAAYDRLVQGIQPLVDADDCVLLGLLVGGMMPLVHLAERLRGDFLLDYCHATRYRGATKGGALEWIQKPRQALRDRTVVLVDDIFDQGRTLAELVRHCREAGARRTVTAVLVRKRHPRVVVDLQPDFVGLEVEDHYVFGCGMDYQHRWRHLDALWALPSGRA